MFYSTTESWGPSLNQAKIEPVKMASTGLEDAMRGLRFSKPAPRPNIPQSGSYYKGGGRYKNKGEARNARNVSTQTVDIQTNLLSLSNESELLRRILRGSILVRDSQTISQIQMAPLGDVADFPITILRDSHGHQCKPRTTIARRRRRRTPFEPRDGDIEMIDAPPTSLSNPIDTDVIMKDAPRLRTRSYTRKNKGFNMSWGAVALQSQTTAFIQPANFGSQSIEDVEMTDAPPL
ncbi:hypothetical protein ASPZODRAFT_138347 [Penicilliopsis zonata CBS 506.65]|uniref:Uncharacterized protein n=1 Tax=Penicilliopsis zonata CBS 506.65 TaxID=1073090 RepID=A0A1L9SVJ3_9EURO|nr:hypothetical protein ASPZODRAFT_138347 [Penicilliopsis zonata CBS 506.65]OJJ51240.1 hypothetical protein ASPZODRAFT_138347 [Penicilliopsis zonata CBS 506.65]